MPFRVLILGAAGMLGHTLFTQLLNHENYDVYASARNLSEVAAWCPPDCLGKVTANVNAEDFESLTRCMTEVKPQVVINCIGIIKQLPSAKDSLKTITVNALLPHRMALICNAAGARLIQISTDCVFSGAKGNYCETDPPDPEDLYGRTKLLGEVDYPHCLTLRTSIIGHELKGGYGLVEWFLSREEKTKGYTGAIYSGLPTIELAGILKNHVIPNPDLNGLYHVSARPVSKYELLKLIAKIYGRNIEIEPDDQFRADRSLDSTRFKIATGYSPPAWAELIGNMHRDFITAPHYKNRCFGG